MLHHARHDMRELMRSSLDSLLRGRDGAPARFSSQGALVDRTELSTRDANRYRARAGDRLLQLNLALVAPVCRWNFRSVWTMALVRWWCSTRCRRRAPNCSRFRSSTATCACWTFAAPPLSRNCCPIGTSNTSRPRPPIASFLRRVCCRWVTALFFWSATSKANLSGALKYSLPALAFAHALLLPRLLLSKATWTTVALATPNSSQIAYRLCPKVLRMHCARVCSIHTSNQIGHHRRCGFARLAEQTGRRFVRHRRHVARGGRRSGRLSNQSQRLEVFRRGAVARVLLTVLRSAAAPT